MAASPAIRVEGLAQLVRGIRRANSEVGKGLVRELKAVGGVVAKEAKDTAHRKGLRRSGDLIAGIRPAFHGNTVTIRSGASQGSFNYPRRLEFESRGAAVVGPRATLWPAVDAKRAEVVKRFERLLDRVEDVFERGA